MGFGIVTIITKLIFPCFHLGFNSYTNTSLALPPSTTNINILESLV